MNLGSKVGNPPRSLLGSAAVIALLAAALLSVTLPATTSFTAGPTIQICVALDGSTSIASADFTTMKNGLASAIEDSTVLPQNGTIEMSVIQFYSLTGITDVIASPTVIDGAAAASNVASLVRAAAKGTGGTPTDRAIDKCSQLITGSPNFAVATKQVINISTDGDPENQPLTVIARDNAVNSGIDEVDLEAIGPDPSTDKMLQIAYPGAGYLAPPFNGAGFVIKVANYADYSSAIRQKLEQIIPRPPATPTATGTITPTPTSTGTATPTPTPTASPAPTPTPIVQNGGFESDGSWTLLVFQRNNTNPNSGGWSVNSTAGQNGRIYQVVQVPTDTVGIMLYFNWANLNPDISTAATCLDYLQVKIMDPSLTQLYGSSRGYCASAGGWNNKGLDFRYLLADIRGKSIALVFEVLQDSVAPNTTFFIDDVILYLYDKIIYVPVGFRDTANMFLTEASAGQSSVELVPPAVVTPQPR